MTELDPTALPPADDPLRRRIAREAGRGVVRGSDARRATFRAARRVARDWVPEDQMPAASEVGEEALRRIEEKQTQQGTNSQSTLRITFI
jgi:hypothetical protein